MADPAALPQPPAGTTGYFVEENGLVKVQFEDIAGGATPPTGWVYQDASNGNNPGFEGDGYYYWKDEDGTGLNNRPTQGAFSTTIYIQEAGGYSLFVRSTRDSNTPSDARNDLWVKVDDDTVPLLTVDRPMVTEDGFVKIYGTSTDWTYSKKADDLETDDNPAARVRLSEGFHTLTFAGRSEGFHIDSFSLIKSRSPDFVAVEALESSQFVTEGDDQVGEAVLTITPNAGIQDSNYGRNSFWVENTGDKVIAKIEIDVANALFPDTVFDPFGQAGDTVSKPLTIDTAGSTGVKAPTSASYIGAGGTAGYEKIQVLFDEAVSGGFQAGEAMGFAIDMDPNSIAGSDKVTLDAGSDPTWDVGGVSGAELIGSTFTVTFTDGTTATGQLQGVTDSTTTNDQGGAKALASQAVSGGAVELQVNGLAPGEAGTYAAGGPQVIIDGPAGQTARIVLVKGFIQPGENLFSEPYKSQLDAQLADLGASDFPANNAVQFQVKDIVLTGSPQDITSLFNFTTVPVAGVANADSLPLGFVASLIDPSRDGLATGPVTAPIYLVAEDDAANTAPVAANDSVSTGASAVTVNVLANDGDADGDPLALASFGQGANGTVTRNTNGTAGDQTDDRLVYTPNEGFTGTDSFTYTINDGEGGSDTGTVAVTVSGGGGMPAFELNINAGGGAYTAVDGTEYVADTYFVGGSQVKGGDPVAGTEDDTLYNTWRSGAFGYNIPVANGTYVIELQFAETVQTGAGQRRFDVKVEGATVLDDLDIWASAGGADIAFVTPSIEVEVTDGFLNIDFAKVLKNPIVQGISIRSAGTGGGNAAPVAEHDTASSSASAVTVNVLANDSDADGDPLALASFGQGVNGTVTRNTNGTAGDQTDDRLVYTPNEGFAGTDSFTYTINDGQGGSDTGTVEVTVTSTPAFELNINAGGGAYTAVDGTEYVADTYFVGGSQVKGGDPVAGTEDDTLYNTWRSGAFGYNIPVANGTYVIELQFAETVQTGAGQRRFDVKVEGATVLDDLDIWASAGGADIAFVTPSIEVEVTDGFLNIDFAKVLKNPIVQGISIRTAGTPPVAEDDTASSSGSAVTVNVLANDSDADGDPLALASFGQGVNGTVTRDTNGTPGDQTDDRLVYTPNEGFAGTDSFTYTINDGRGGSDTGTVEVTVTSTPAFELNINAGGGAYTAVDGTEYVADTYFVGGSQVKGGDPVAGTEDDTLYNTWRSGAFGYNIPVANGTYVIELQFAETVQTGAGQRRFDVKVEGATVLDDLDIWASAGGADIAFVTPSIEVEVTDGFLNIDFAKVLKNPIVQGISIRSTATGGGNAAPVTSNDAYTVAEDGTLTIVAPGVLANDVDPDDDPMTASVVTGPTNGSVMLNANGSFTYIPAQNFTGTDSFTYAATDAAGHSTTATATIQVTAVNDAPVAVADGYVTPVGTGLHIIPAKGVLDNDVDVEGDTLSVTAVNGAAAQVGTEITLASGAKLTLNANGSFDYVPPAGFSGEDSFTYLVGDGITSGNSATVTIDVVSSEPPVVETNAGAAVNEAGSTAITAAMLKTTDPDTSPDLLVYKLTEVPANGTLKLGTTVLGVGDSFTQTDIDNGMLSYAHNSSETLTDGFGYTVSDGLFTISGQSFEISVSPVNDLPVAGDDHYTADHDTLLTIPAGGVLANDADPDGPGLAVTAVNGAFGQVGSEITLPSGAKLTLNADGSFTYDPLAGFSGEDSFTYTVNDGAGGTDTGTVSIDVAPAEPAFQVHINVGGSAYTAADGTSYIADKFFTGGKKTTTTTAIAGTEDDPLFQTARQGAALGYSIPVNPGSYSISLDFAEFVYDATGKRVFDVVIEGKTVINDLDIWKSAGDQFTAYEAPAVIVDVLDGSLDIEFVKGAQTPVLSGISVVDVTSNDNTPIAQSDAVETRFGTEVNIDVLSNDVDFDDDDLQIVSVGGEATLGTVTINDAGTPGDTTDDYLVYTSNGTGTGTDTFTYTIADETGKTATATVEVEVLPLDAIAFDKVPVTGLPDMSWTSLQFGADGRLYASHRFGEIFSIEIEPQIDPVTGKITSYAATDVDTISILKTIKNHNDDGTLAPSVTNRQVTGITVTGTAENPVIYVVSSDPREGGGGGGGDGDLGLDTNSGVLSRLTWNGSAWEKLDLVRGLPRSEENHSTNGLLLTTDPETGHRVLLAAQGGNTNAGAPSNNFAYGNETALSASILKIDLTELESGAGQFTVKTDGANKYVYDLPTVMADQSGVTVFGGRDGLNQARLVEGGPVSIYSSGWRNPYDLVKTEAGEIFTIDNGANQGWGGLPSGEGTATPTNQLPTNDPDGFNSVNNLDHLERILGEGYYGGHPNPVRANPSGAGIIYTDANGQEVWTPNPGGAWPPVDPSFSFPNDGNYLQPGVEDGALVTWGVSTNGLAEYTSSAFQGAMKGNLITAAFDSSIYRIVLDPSGNGATKEVLASGLSGIPLDVIAQGDDDPFAGTIWISYVAGEAEIEVLVPTFATGTPDDLDGDGYTNADETANETNPFSPSSKPADNDKDFVSDLGDDDDDNDTVLDAADHFALDGENGTGRVITNSQPFLNPLRNDDPGTGFAGLGFTGWMSNGTSDYLDLYDDDNLIAGGTSGIFTIINTDDGDARGSLNTQNNGFQFGVVQATAGPMLVQASMLNVFSPLTEADLATGQAAGIQIGTGDQDNYVKLAVGVDASGQLGIVLLHEENGIVLEETFMPGGSVAIGDEVDLFLEINEATGTVTSGWKINGGAGQTGSAVTVAGDLLDVVQGTYENGGEDSALAVGVIATSGPTGDDFAAQYDFINVFGSTLADEFDLMI